MRSATIIPIIPRIKLKRILLATDFSTGSSTALPIAATLARRYDAEVMISNVWAPMPFTMATPETVNTLEQQQERAARQKLSEILQTAGTLGISPRAIVRSGDPVEEIDRIVREQAIDLVILSTHGRVGFRHLAMGSVAESLFRNLSCPVLTVGPHLAHRFLGNVNIEHILFPTDLSEESQSVFAYLASLADEYGARLTVLHVLPEETHGNPEAQSLAKPLRDEMIRLFSPSISSRCEADFIIDFGNPADTVLRHAHELHADLIGLGIRRATDVVTHLRNTVAYKVILEARCPVLTQRLRHTW
jgi:nucleotide-binding universal stress UspA family protein